jgi:dihydrofolate reductase
MKGLDVRKIINSTYITLDGAIQNPQDWPATGGFSDDVFAIQSELLLGCDAVLMGRRTYEACAPAWSAGSGNPYTERINNIPKYVVSSTLHNPEWTNTTIIDHDPIGDIRALKSQPGQDIVQYGFGQLSDALMANGLLDELRLWVHPFFVGQGGPDGLVYRERPTTRFALIGARTLTSGIVVLSYAKSTE